MHAVINSTYCTPTCLSIYILIIVGGVVVKLLAFTLLSMLPAANAPLLLYHRGKERNGLQAWNTRPCSQEVA